MSHDITPLCVGKSALFDSTHPADHIEAKALCDACPAIEACRRLRDDTRRGSGYAQASLEGTWAGELYGGRRLTVRKIAEDAAYTEEEARRCAAAWSRGERSEYLRVGRRVYERRGDRRRRGAA